MAIRELRKGFLGSDKTLRFFGGINFFWWITGNGYFCLGGTGFSADLSDKYLVPTSKYEAGISVGERPYVCAILESERSRTRLQPQEEKDCWWWCGHLFR